MPTHAAVTKHVDSKGRITLGRAFANQTVLVEDRGSEVVVRLGRTIPASEAWLYENEKALASVRRGLAQARSRTFAKGPDLKAARRLSDAIRGEPT